MRYRLVLIRIVLPAALMLGGAAGWWLTSPDRDTAGLEPLTNHSPDIANGQLLFDVGNCASCHATLGKDRLHLGGGYAMETPFGVFYAPNISPDVSDGIGGWSDREFVRAMRAGVSPQGAHYYPAFPYTSFQKIAAKDLVDLFAYIKTLEPISGKAPEHELALPFKLRRAIGLWKALFLDDQVFKPDPTKSDSWNRGKFLVEGPGHCAECHSPRNFAGAIVEAKRFSGGLSPDGKGYVPNITPHATGIGKWSKDEIIELLTTGFTPEFDSVGAGMATVVNSTSRLPLSDREAIAEYLLSLPPVVSSR